MFIDITHPAIDNDTICPQVTRPGGHEPAPASRVEAFRLLNVHNLPSLIEVCEMSWQAGGLTLAHLHHLHRNRRTEESFLTALSSLGRPHGESIEESPKRILELHQRISDLKAPGVN